MCPRPHNGFALPAAVFLIAILGVMMAAVSTLTGTAADTLAGDINGIKAGLAARTGLEYGVNRAVAAGCWNGTLDLSARTGLRGFRAVITCATQTADEGGATLTFFTITSTACNAALCPAGSGDTGTDYAERMLRGTVVRCTAGSC